ncbi:MAG: AAA family ATPase [Bacteroidales bacterium]|nr:AAA family ATPase [Bacteroidales bacterium]MDD6139957.1 AAA family ATPase [Bacteroidales bacterium]MDD6622269.1 AAA family ATPase [Bacteroidales bacterium]MDD6669666.1 AAA family ATPase [Bacteroidales bacterium]
MKQLIENYRRLLSLTATSFHRYLYEKVNWSGRMVGIVGARGVGKTTMILQYAKERLDFESSLYVNAEDFYFSSHRLFDLADSFCKQGGKYLLIDEVHRYDGWSRELKLIYDYHPELHVVFSGSSILDITKGVQSDLSRRAVVYDLYGLSFREYLELFEGVKVGVKTLEEVLSHAVEMPTDFRPLVSFGRYLRRGYYPFALEDDYEEKLRQVVVKTLETDIPEYANMNVSTGKKLKRLMAVIAESVPFKPNNVTLAEVLGVSRNNVADYLLYIEKSGLITQLRDQTGGVLSLGKVDKVYLENTNLIYALANDGAAEIGNVRETFFMNQLRVVADPITSSVSDFMVGNRTFEVGGRNKKQKQIRGIENAYVVKDDIEYGGLNVVPLWQFGLLY